MRCIKKDKVKYVKTATTFIIIIGILINSLTVMASPIDETTEIVQYDKTEIQDVDTLIFLADQGVDEFKDKTGLAFHLESQLVGEQATVISLNAPSTIEEAENIEIYKTSQYLGTILTAEGEIEELYALNGVILYSDPSKSDTKTNGGCTITTTLHCAWNSDGMKLRLIDSQAYLTGTLRPQSLLMENNAYEGWITNEAHYNSRTVSLPSNGYYTLPSNYSGYIADMGAYLIAEDTLSFGSGGTLKTHVDVSPE